jgi:hypothetical protein
MAGEQRQVGVRFEGDSLSRIELHQARLQASAGTVKVTFSDAVRDLVLIGLHAAEHDETEGGQS